MLKIPFEQQLILLRSLQVRLFVLLAYLSLPPPRDLVLLIHFLLGALTRHESRVTEILPDFLQIIAKALPLVYIFEEVRSILINNTVNYAGIGTALLLNILYLFIGIVLFYFSFSRERMKRSLINIGE